MAKLMEAQPLIKQGIACRVGGGDTVFVLNDPWLPDTNDPYVHTLSEALQNVRVSSLMSMSANQWDHDVILDIFTERDANLIFSIPVNKTEKDTWYWKFEKLGHYLVKSAYGSIQDGKENHYEDNSGFWRQLLNLKMPPKVKHFMWRVVTGSLPTKDNLRCKRVEVNICCPVCQNGVESILHTMVTCSFADTCWKNSGIPCVIGEFHSFTEWLQLVFQQHNRNGV